MFLDMSGTGEPHPWSWTALCSQRNKVAKPCYSNRMERRGHDAPCAGARTFFSNRIVHGQRGAPGRPCAPSVPRCFYFGRKTDFACQDVSAAAEKRARWNCRWHPTTAGPMDECCSLLLAALARAGRAGTHSSVPMPLELGAVYSITTFIRDIRTLLQIRQVAHLMEHYMQPA